MGSLLTITSLLALGLMPGRMAPSIALSRSELRSASAFKLILWPQVCVMLLDIVPQQLCISLSITPSNQLGLMNQLPCLCP